MSVLSQWKVFLASQPADCDELTVPDAIERLERLQSQGEPWTSQADMAERFTCSPSTINKALKEASDATQRWAKVGNHKSKKARGRTLTEADTDNIPQAREQEPAEQVDHDAVLARLLDEAAPEIRATSTR